MTIINRTYGFAFIHVPKTGGTSVKEHLREYARGGDLYINRPSDAGPLRSKLKKHSTAVQLRSALGQNEFDALFKFCVVRNPFLRAFSLFRFLKYNFHAWPRAEMMELVHSLEDFVSSPIFRNSGGPGGIVSPQVQWLTDRAGKGHVDYIARVERIEEDISQIRTRLQLPSPSRPLLRRNVSKGDAGDLIAGLASGKVVDAVRTQYARDFQFLGYSTDPDEAIELEQPATVAVRARR